MDGLPAQTFHYALLSCFPRKHDRASGLGTCEPICNGRVRSDARHWGNAHNRYVLVAGQNCACNRVSVLNPCCATAQDTQAPLIVSGAEPFSLFITEPYLSSGSIAGRTDRNQKTPRVPGANDRFRTSSDAVAALCSDLRIHKTRQSVAEPDQATAGRVVIATGGGAPPLPGKFGNNRQRRPSHGSFGSVPSR